MPRTPDRSVNLHRDGPTWLIYVQLSLYAYFLYAFAPSVTLLRDDEHVRDTVAGLHGTAYAVGVIVVGLLGARILDAVGRGRALWLFLGALCVSIAIYASVPVLPVTLVGALLCGASASGVTITVGAALVERHGRGRTGRGHRGQRAGRRDRPHRAATGRRVGAPRLRLAPGRVARHRADCRAVPAAPAVRRRLPPHPSRGGGSRERVRATAAAAGTTTTTGA